MIIPSTDEQWLDAVKAIDAEFMNRNQEFNYADFINRCDRHAHYAAKQDRNIIANHFRQLSHKAWFDFMDTSGGLR